jgi:flagellar biogenesis protein FliO
MSFEFLRPPANMRKPHSALAALRLRLRRYWTVIRTPAPARQLRVRETLQIGDKRQLMVVDVGERQLLIGAAGNCLTMLAELDRHSKTERAWNA